MRTRRTTPAPIPVGTAAVAGGPTRDRRRRHYGSNGPHRDSRAGTTLHAIADDLPQLQQHLALGWSNDQHQRWITDVSAQTPPLAAGPRRPRVPDRATDHGLSL